MPHEAKEMGLINRVVPLERLDDEVNELAFHVAQAPLTTLMAAKANIRRAWDLMGLRNHLQQSNDLLTVATRPPTCRSTSATCSRPGSGPGMRRSAMPSGPRCWPPSRRPGARPR